MNVKNKYSKIIANYLYYDMSQKERTQFEKDLLVNKELATEYKLQSSAIKYLKAKITLEEMKSDPNLAEAERLAEEMLSEEGNVAHIDSKKIRVLFNDKRILIRRLAAAVILIGIVSSAILVFSSSNQSLYKSYYAPFNEAFGNYRGNNGVTNTSITKGVKLYISANYIDAIVLFQKLYEENPGDPVSSFYLGLSQLGNSDFLKAISLFEAHLKTFEVYQPEVKWYLALCYLKTDRVNDAYLLLEDLSVYPGKYGDNSKKLAKKLEKKIEN
jgi:hypothetical protein